jgi:pimeloyl-ACP methyl ester carboxylesterase
MPFATTPDGTRLYFECHGTGTPLLLLAGQASDHREWDGVRADFAAQHRVIVLDYRGTGQSDKPGAPAYSTRGFAQDAVAVLDQLGLNRAHAYGISMGGRVAQWLAIDHPQRLGALVGQRHCSQLSPLAHGGGGGAAGLGLCGGRCFCPLAGAAQPV